MKHNRILFNFELLSFGNNNIIEGVEDEVTLDFLSNEDDSNPISFLNQNSEIENDSMSSLESQNENDDDNYLTEKNCENCKCKYYQHKNEVRRFDKLFHSTCPECTQHCSSCGQEVGYVKYGKLISTNECSFCQKETCMSCGVNVTCSRCGITCCEECFRAEEHVCMRLKKKFEVIEDNKGINGNL